MKPNDIKPLVFAAILLIAGCTPSETVVAPAAACRAVYTGATRDDSYYTPHCMPMGNSPCGMMIQTYMPVTSREVHMVCDWKEWR